MDFISKVQVDELRSEFKKYLKEKNPDWSDNTVATNYSDAFYAFNNNIGPDFWSCFTSDEKMREAHDRLYSHFVNEKQSDRAKERADGYLTSMGYFKDFLDEKHPSLAHEWSGKTVSNIYLKTAFENWMRNQKKSNGEPYKSNTITAYSNALKNSTAKLNLGEAVLTDLFYYTSVEAFKAAHSIITNAPNFKEIDLIAGNSAYSTGMVLYEKFLKETAESGRIFPVIDTPPTKKRYWMYAPGEGSRFWEEFYDKGIMGIGWEELGDLKQYDSKEVMKQKMKEIYGEEYSYKNDGYATWQFANEMNLGDIVFVKKGREKIIGRGIITSDYIYDKERDEFNNIRRVEWTHKGEWDHEGQIVLKTLTDITPYTDYCRKLENLLAVVVVPPEIKYDPYTEDDFLKEVFMDRERYLNLKNLLLKKKNIILEGAPGVGKTFMAERLAFSIMGEKDISRVRVVQFHQSYSYEDFIMGYRPTEQGFTLKTGAFYDFCKEAEPDDKEYFFIIDEINRGNLSKIFGELLMLIENDKRGKEIRLLYQDEQFAVPKNVYIIGMMNTADRSLAMIDYALRRRFSFFEMPPAFESKGFIEYQGKVADKKFDNLVKTVIEMNSEISADASLGDGFRIGHSYFCTDHEINDEWLNSLVEYELLPLIKEYWFDEPTKIEHWSLKLRGAIHD